MRVRPRRNSDILSCPPTRKHASALQWPNLRFQIPTTFKQPITEANLARAPPLRPHATIAITNLPPLVFSGYSAAFLQISSLRRSQNTLLLHFSPSSFPPSASHSALCSNDSSDCSIQSIQSSFPCASFPFMLSGRFPRDWPPLPRYWRVTNCHCSGLGGVDGTTGARRRKTTLGW